ncbi:MAG: hypothetical protein PQJ60_04450, partial [Spirochaetales bacterium]|nr:hypothetical protein [Spirochaetales bacterium]
KVLGDEDEIYISEPLIFALALEFEELKSEVVETAKSLVAAMRRYNTTDAVWIDDMRLFGVDALYLVAEKYPEYTYLLGQYFIPYWDHEHATGYEGFLFSLVEKYGWTRDLIKAYIWCDNGHFRHYMFNREVFFLEGETGGNQDLGSFLKESPQEYQWFKEEMINRFKEQPVLMYSSSSEIESRNPVVEFYLSLLCPCGEYHDEEADELTEYLQSDFLGRTLEDEAFDLQELVEKSVETPLMRYDEKALESRERSAYMDRDKYRGDDLENLKEFILALPEGGPLWEYIEQGKGPEILEKIGKTALVPIAREQARNFYFDMTYTLSPLDFEGGISEELDTILSGVLSDLVFSREEEPTSYKSNGLVMNITVRKSGEARKEADDREKGAGQFLRILDVFYRLLGKAEICEGLREMVTDEEGGWNLIGLDDFYKRYSTKGRPGEKKLSLDHYSFDHTHTIDKDSLKYVEAVIKQNGREAYDCSRWKEPNLGRLTLAVYLLYKDRQEGNFDETTQKLIDYLGKGPWEMGLNQLKKHLDLEKIPEADLKLIEDYFTVEPLNPMDLLMGKVSKDEAPVLADQETIVGLLEEYLYREEVYRGDLVVNKFSEHQKSYSLFFYRDGFQNIILSCYWMGHLVPPHSLIADRILKVLIALAPQRVIRQIGRFYSEDYSLVEFEDKDSEERFYTDLERTYKVPKEQIYAFQMGQAQNKKNISEPCDVEEYLYWINIYDEIDSEESGMFGAINKNRALALEKGLDYISEKARLKFYIDLALQNPRFPLNQEKEFCRCLSLFIQRNRRDESPLSSEAILDKTLAYLDGEIPYREMGEIFKQNITEELRYELSRTTNYNLGHFVWQLPESRQGNLFTLLLNHSVRGFRILEDDLFYSYLRHLVKEEELSMEEYLDASPEQGGDEIEGYREESYEFLQEHIQGLEIKKENLIAFYLQEDISLYRELCVEMARNGIVEKKLARLSDSQRSKLIQIFQEEEDAKDLVRVFKNDKSRKVKALAKSILNS